MLPADVVLLLLLVTLAVAALAQRARTPAPVILAVAGIAIGIAWRYLPGLPRLVFPPRLVLLIFLPPLLLNAAYALPLGAFKASLRSILMLAVGLVLATTFGVALVARLALPSLPWVAAIALGAIIAPPDPVAASAVAQRTGLSHRLVTILEGEGLINDAIAIVLYELAVQAAVSGRVTWGDAALANPTGALQVRVSQLRRALDDAQRGARELIESRPPG